MTSHVTDVVKSAVPGEDYTHRDVTVNFDPGDTYVLVYIDLIDDSFKEDYEAFRVTLSDCENGALSQPDEAYVGIIDDDTVEGIIEIYFCVQTLLVDI